MIPQTIFGIRIANILSALVAVAVWQGFVIWLDSLAAQIGLLLGGVVFALLNMRYSFWIYGLWSRLIYIGLATLLGPVIALSLEVYKGTPAYWAIAFFWLTVMSWLLAIVVVHHNGLSVWHAKSHLIANSFLKAFKPRGRMIIGWIIIGGLIATTFFADYISSHHVGRLALAITFVAFVVYFLVFAFGPYFIRALNIYHEKFEIWCHEKLEPMADLEAGLLLQRPAISLFMFVLLTTTLIFASLYYSVDYYQDGKGFGIRDGQTISYFEAFYFSVITAATVGYGDIAPKSDIVRSIVILQVLTSFWLVTFALNIIVVRLTKLQSQVPDAYIDPEDMKKALAEVEKSKNDG